MKLKRRMMGILLLFSLLPLCIFGLFSIREMNKKIDSMTECNLKATSENQITSIQKFASERKSQMEKVANYELTKEAIWNSLGKKTMELNRKYLDNLLLEQKKYGTYVASVSILDKNFRVVGSSEKYVYGEISKLEEIDEKFHTGEFIIGNVYERQTDEGLKRVVPAYIGVYEAEELIGYVSEELDTAYFNDLRLSMDAMYSGTIYLLDGVNTIITAGDNTKKDSLHEFVTSNEQRSDFQEKWNAVDHKANPSGEIRYSYNNQEYITYYANVENTEWSIRVTENLTVQKQDMRAYTILLELMLASFILGTIVTQSFVTTKIMAPIESAQAVFKQIKEKQDYSLRIPIKAEDEMGELSKSINELLAYVEKETIHEKITQHELREQAENDPLTGIKNKRTIEKYIVEMVSFAAETKEQITIGFLDIDDFRNFNTIYGHQQGDEIIHYVAKTLQENLLGQVGRIGGDEFIFCYVGTLAMEKISADIKHVLTLLEDGYVNPVNQRQLAVTSSIGIVTAKGENLDYTELIHRADKAMYQAKEKGKNTFVILTL